MRYARIFHEIESFVNVLFAESRLFTNFLLCLYSTLHSKALDILSWVGMLFKNTIEPP